MSQADVDTTAHAENGAPAEAQPSSPAAAPVNATAQPIDVEKIRRQAEKEAWAKFQAKADRDRAKELKAQREAERARAEMKQAGVQDETALDNVVLWRQQAARLQEIEAAEAEQAAAVQEMARVAAIYKVDPTHPDLQGLGSWDEFHAKALGLAQTQADAALAAARKAAEEAKRRAVDSEIESGAADVLGAGPALPGNTQGALEKEYRQKVTRIRGNVQAIHELKKEFRAKGLKI